MSYLLGVIAIAANLSAPSTSLSHADQHSIWKGQDARLADRPAIDFERDSPNPNDSGASEGKQESPKTRAQQTDNQDPSSPAPSTNAGESSSRQQLPDKPIPKDITPREGCPDVDGAPCANFGGFRFFRNTTFTEHDRTWGQAMSHPIMWLMATAAVVSTVFDIEGTQHCLAANTCVEGNPILGKHPSRLRAYGTSAPLVAFTVFSMGYLKERGRGFPAFIVGLVPTALHLRFGMEAWAYSSRRTK